MYLGNETHNGNLSVFKFVISSNGEVRTGSHARQSREEKDEDLSSTSGAAVPGRGLPVILC